ncbi:MAG TPA: DUF3368 domain-containing protein [Thermoanaerobaculia bacterium]|nr:DUF3368 domain-containing protein [Thermoanaerobaculia bacterium]
MPRAVRDEVSAGGPERPGCRAILNADWIEVIDENVPDPLLAAELGAGEAATIAAAYASGIRSVLIDDRKARRIAVSAYKLHVHGSAGILVIAKRAGLVNAVRPLLDLMVARGYYLSRRLVEQATAAAGETGEAG